MRGIGQRVLVAALVGNLMLAGVAMPQEVKFADPAGDDNGTGKYVYPTDPVFEAGAFDMTGFRLKAHSDHVDLEVTFDKKLTDPWKGGNGFSLQLVFIFIQTEPRSVPPASGAAAGAGATGTAAPAAAGAAGAAAGALGTAATASTTAAGTAEAGATTSGTPTTAGAAADSAAVGTTAAGTADPATTTGANGPNTTTGTAATTVATASAAAKSGATSPAGKTAAKAPVKLKPGITQGLPGLNVQFTQEQSWDKCIVLAPDLGRLRQEVADKVPAALQAAVIVPSYEKGSGKVIEARVDRKALPAGDPRDWGYQVVVASYDPYPTRDSLMVRPVDQLEGQFRFGGASGGGCDPNVIDLLAGAAAGEPGESNMQYLMLQSDCKTPAGQPRQLAALNMVRIKKDLTREEKRAKRKEDREKAKTAKQPGAETPPAATPPPPSR